MREYRLGARLVVSFQRYPLPEAGYVTGLVTSRGALPFLVTRPGRLLLPCPTGEAFWIGVVAADLTSGTRSRVAVQVRTASRGDMDAADGTPLRGTGPATMTELLPGRPGVPGIARGDGTWWPFTRDPAGSAAPACVRLDLVCHVTGRTGPGPETGALDVEVVDPEQFRAAGGDPVPPLDPGGGQPPRRLP